MFYSLLFTIAVVIAIVAGNSLGDWIVRRFGGEDVLTYLKMFYRGGGK